ncbi:unnamed protein product [marine sediment metagenome]|uniref:Uncharacterized protein n=1 Tax=marine sediment metagenome TaxID=412755 RepID=X1TAA5_9ZZZZ
MMVSVIGTRGTGKSTLLKNIMHRDRLLVIDTLGEHAGELDTFFRWDAQGLAEFFSRDRKRFRVGFQPKPDTGEFEAACELAWALGNLTVLVDEVDQYAQAGVVPIPLQRLIMLGRHRAISGAATVRRPPDMPRAWTAVSDRWAIFRVTEPRDLAYLAGVLGDEVKVVSSLPDFQFFFRDWGTKRAGIYSVHPGGTVRLVKTLGA